jgi:hypothetical protein
VLQRIQLPGYKPWLATLPSVGGVTPLLLSFRGKVAGKSALGLMRANYSGGRVSSFTEPRLYPPSESGVDGEWAIFSLSDGSVLLTSGSGFMTRSTDQGQTFRNVSTPHATGKVVDGGEFDCEDECGSWTVLELHTPQGGLPAGVFTFTDNTLWISSDMGRSFR